MIKSFRLQLTAWYLLLFTLLFLGFSLFLYGVLSRSLYRRLDEALSSEARTATGPFQDELGEHKGDALAAAGEVIGELNFRGALVAVFEGNKLLAASAPVENRELLDIVAQASVGGTELHWTASKYGNAGARAVAHPFVLDDRHFVLLAAESLDATVAELALVRRMLYLALPLVVSIAGIGGFLLAAKSLAPLRWMAEQASTITGKNLNTRLAIGSAHEELRLLADSFNELLSRLDQSFETMQRFVADASHELRTPLSVIRGEADVALARDRSPGEYRESLIIIQDEARRLSRLVDDLLNLARADAGHVNLRLEEFYLNDLLAECCRSAQTAARAKNVDLECRSPEDVSFHGDRELLRRLVMNLLDNAIRYTPEAGKVLVILEAAGADLRLQVSDTGTGIPPEVAPHLFARFYRGDQARARQNGGFGLGLSIVKWIAESHQGRVEFTSGPDAGTTFTVLLHR
jgi:two-component system, OmpR family, sensor kinase